jgi:antitoxin (DNA-binding transcriptional repressor) of toxin-antitoxin stability system
LVITRRGRPIARITPIGNDGDLIGILAGELKIQGNIFSAADER